MSTIEIETARFDTHVLSAGHDLEGVEPKYLTLLQKADGYEYA